ncbi:MAG: paraquat-inducible protein A, partial [Desulfobacterales bacterium]|nr:paraquat-inducible protein A [Desulfobacterales bacterium]
MILEANTQDTPDSDFVLKDWIACHECDLVHTRIRVPSGQKAKCCRCGATLYGPLNNSMDKALALNLTALVLLVLSNTFPFLTLKFQGAMVENHFISGLIRLYQMGMGEISMLVLLTSLIFPLVNILGMIYVLLPLKLGFQPWFMARVFGLADALRSWSLISVFMLGVLVSMVKLLELADIIPGISMAAFIALMVVLAAAHASLDPEEVWARMEPERNETVDLPGVPGHFIRTGAEGPTAAQLGLISCHTCGKLLPDTGDHGQACDRCQRPVHSRKGASLQQTWALLVSAVILFIPAN